MSWTTTASAGRSEKRCAVSFRMSGCVMPFEPAACGRVSKHDLSECLPVEAAVRAEQMVTERLGHGRQPRRPGGDHLAGQRVRVDHDRAVRDEQPRHGALARPDTARQTHCQHAASLPPDADRDKIPRHRAAAEARRHHRRLGGWETGRVDVAAEPPPSADEAVPQDVRVRRRWPTVVRRTWPVGLTTLLLALGWVGLASSAALYDTAPLLLVALRPTPSIILLAGPHAPFAAALVVAAVGRCLFDVAVFGTFRNNIRSFLLPRPLGGRLVRWLSRRGTERGLLWFCLVNTNIPVDTALGTSSVPWRRFVRFVGAGSVITSAVYLLSSRAVSGTSADVVSWIDRNLALFILATATLGAVQAFVLWRRAATRNRTDGPA